MSRQQPEFPQIPGQLGMATKRQLLDSGFTRAAIIHALKRSWQEPYSGVCVPHRGQLDDDRRLVAAALWAGPHAVLTGYLALERYGLTFAPGIQGREGPAGPRHPLFLVPSTARSRDERLARTVRTTRGIAIKKHIECVQLASIDRALIDMALHQDVPAREVKAMTLAALQRRLTHVDLIVPELHRVRRRLTTPIHEAIQLFDKGAWSLPEGAFDELLDSSPELPPRMLNPRVTDLHGVLVGSPDVFFPAAGVAVQVHSKQHHSGYDADGTDLWSLTVEKDGAYSEHSVIVLGVTPRSIARRADAVLQRVRSVVLRNMGRSYGPVVIDGVVYGSPDSESEDGARSQSG